MKNITKKELNIAKQVARFVGVDLRLQNKKRSYAYFDQPNKVYISTKQTPEDFWSELFHELAHCYCYENNIYPIFHKSLMPYTQLVSYYIMFAYKIEKYVDNLGSKLMFVFFPDMVYKYWYRTKVGEASHYVWLADELDGKEWKKFKKQTESKYGKYRKYWS